MSRDAVELWGDFPIRIGSGASVGAPRLVLVSSIYMALGWLSKGYSSNFFLWRMAYTTKQNQPSLHPWALIMALSYSSLIYFFSTSIFPDLTFWLHILPIVFCAAHYITTILAPLNAHFDILYPYPVWYARPTARLAASMSQSGIISR